MYFTPLVVLKITPFQDQNIRNSSWHFGLYLSYRLNTPLLFRSRRQRLNFLYRFRKRTCFVDMQHGCFALNEFYSTAQATKDRATRTHWKARVRRSEMSELFQVIGVSHVYYQLLLTKPLKWFLFPKWWHIHGWKWA